MKTTMILHLLSTIIVFWNVENFFDNKACSDNPSERSFSWNGSRHWTARRVEAKCNSIAKVLLCIADEYGELPAAVGLCEVENDRVLHMLCHETALRHLGYEFIHFDSSDPRGIDCALLYRPSVLGVPDASVIGIARTRDILLCRFRGLSVAAVHLPSKLGAGSAARRDSITRVLAAACDSLSAFGPVVAGGDFNEPRDTRSEELLRPLVELSPDGSLPAGMKGRETDGPTGSLKFQGKWELIDRAAVSPDIASRSRAEVFASPLLLEEDKKFGGVKPRRTYIGPRYNAGVSDHLPLVVEID